MEAIPILHGFKDVKSVETAYRKAQAKLKSLKEARGDTAIAITERKPMTQNQKVSVLKELARRRFEEQQEKENREKEKHEKERFHGKDGRGKEKHELGL